MAKDEQKSKTLIQNSLDSSPQAEVPNHLTLHPVQYKGLVNQIIDSKWVGLKINELLVVEYYSRQT
jgi:small subunit ribosomal protein S4